MVQKVQEWSNGHLWWRSRWSAPTHQGQMWTQHKCRHRFLKTDESQFEIYLLHTSSDWKCTRYCPVLKKELTATFSYTELSPFYKIGAKFSVKAVTKILPQTALLHLCQVEKKSTCSGTQLKNTHFSGINMLEGTLNTVTSSHPLFMTYTALRVEHAWSFTMYTEMCADYYKGLQVKRL